MKRIILGLLASLLALAALLPPVLLAQTSVSTPSNAGTNCFNLASDAVRYDGGLFINSTATIYYLKLYDTEGVPSPTTTSPVRRIPILAATVGAISDVPVTGLHFYSGFGMCLTGGVADADTTTAAAGVMMNFNLTPQ